MANDELVRLINECLNDCDRELSFCTLKSSRSLDTLYNESMNTILKAKAILVKCMTSPIRGIWHSHYDLHDFNTNESLGNFIEIPLEITDILRKGKDPECLTLFICYVRN